VYATYFSRDAHSSALAPEDARLLASPERVRPARRLTVSISIRFSLVSTTVTSAEKESDPRLNELNCT
jgi:hypothetical protein